MNTQIYLTLNLTDDTILLDEGVLKIPASFGFYSGRCRCF